MHFYARSTITFTMQIKKVIILLCSIISFASVLTAGILYEGFDCEGRKNLPFGEIGALGGASSKGWMSSWQLGDGGAVLAKKDIDFDPLVSSPGAALLKGERKNDKFFAKGFMFRQIDQAYEGTVFGSFRLRPGFMTEDTVIGMIFALPNTEDMSVRNGLFAICPKRWGGELGMIGAKGKTYKAVEGAPCVKGKDYLVVWKMSGLPKVGEEGDVSLSFWVLNEAQVSYFASQNFEEKLFNLAEPGNLENNISQFGRKDLKATKRSLYKGIILTPFVYNTTNVIFDEIRISQNGFREAVGVK